MTNGMPENWKNSNSKTDKNRNTIGNILSLKLSFLIFNENAAWLGRKGGNK